MASLTSLLHTARDALTAQSVGVSVTGQNIANVNTPGYTRREVQLANQALGNQTTGGVTVEGLRRVSDVFTERRLFESTGLAAGANEREVQLAPIEALFNDVGGGGLSGALDNMFSSFSALAANPADPSARAAVLDRAETFANRANDVGNALGTAREDLLKQATDTAEQINQKAQAIAALNRRIAEAEASGGDAADLKDQRDGLMTRLASLVDVRTFTDGSGALIVQSSGTTLVEGDVSRSLSIDLASDGRMRVFAQRGSSQPTEITQFLTGGKLAGIREVRDVDVVAVQNKLDRFVSDVAGAVNAQHMAGFDLSGAAGGPIFAFTSGAGTARSVKLDDAMRGQPSRVAAAATQASVPGGAGNATAMYRLSLAQLAGTTRTPAESYSDIVADVGSRRAQALESADMRQGLLAQAQSMRDSVSGVSLDEEMVALTKYQRAYEAAGKVLQTVDEMLRELMQKVG